MIMKFPRVSYPSDLKYYIYHTCLKLTSVVFLSLCLVVLLWYCLTCEFAFDFETSNLKALVNHSVTVQFSSVSLKLRPKQRIPFNRCYQSDI